ncbi:cytosol aminopeptidase-like [Chrysoperla carnea]|uniref:cytosol aminopeptidase-like n=1 Tax=Chrysoperla carnea TaxID=189513 RepID=UPI001D095A90|nr:cytosol aminopeptidase-like [Chrysoperla carnea]
MFFRKTIFTDIGRLSIPEHGITNVTKFILQPKNFCDTKCISLPSKKGLVLGCYENDSGEPVLTPASCKFNEKMRGRLLELIVGSGKSIWKSRQGFAFCNIEDEFWSIVIVGLGNNKDGFNMLEAIDEGRENVRLAAGLGCQHLLKQRCGHIFIEGLGRPEQAAEGAALAVWRYQEFKNKINRLPVPTLELYDNVDHESWQRGLFKAEAQNLTRRLSDTPANHLTPTAFAQEAVKLLCPCGVKVEIHDKEWIYNKRMHALLLTAKGSCEPPVFIEIHYCGAPVEEKPVVLVGKSTTYDSGGLCLYDAKGMPKYRADMTGAAAVISTIRAAALLSLPMNIIGLIPVCENMPSGMAMKPGDLVQMLNGKVIEIESTANEGRIILADALCYACNEYNPKLIIDLTPMTTGHRHLLGSSSTACFSNSENMWKQIHKAGIITGDRLWRLPLWKFYKRKVENYRYCDVNNVGHGGVVAEPCLGAAFLTNFIDCVDWIHLDCDGTGRLSSKEHEEIYPYYAYDRMTGRPVRTVIQLLYQLACPNDCDHPY